MYSRVYVEITNICNRSCSFCPKTKREPRRMTHDEFEKICVSLNGVTEYIYCHLMGEPLTHPLLPEFIRTAKKHSLKTAVTTNGTLLDKAGAALIEAGVYKVSISLHSFEDGSTEEYENYLDTCFGFSDKASKAGVLVVLRLWNRGFDGGRNTDILDKLKKRFPEGDWKEGSRGIRIRDKLHLEYGDRFVWPDMEKEDLGSDVFCYGLKDHFGILVDGSVVPCCLDHEGDVTLGNIFESDINDILASERAAAIREGFKSREAGEALCRRCGYARRFR